MRILAFLVISLNLSLYAAAQNIVILQDPVTNKMFSSTKYSEINGTPFLIDKWINGSASIEKGTYHNVELKLDAYANQVLFKYADETFEFQDDVKSFVLKPGLKDSASYLYFKKGISGPSLKANQYVQVLAEGKISFYKSDVKLLSEVNEINRGVVQAFNTASRYYLIKGSNAQLIKLSKSDILDHMKDREKEVNEFVTTNKISFKREGDIATLIKYYNSL